MDHLWTPWRMAYLQGDQPKPPGCIFCNAVASPDADERKLILHRGQHCFIILNLYPYNNGHLMVVPFAHTESIEQLPPDALAEMMSTLIADPARRAAMSKAGLERVKQFDIEPMVEHYAELFEELALQRVMVTR